MGVLQAWPESEIKWDTVVTPYERSVGATGSESQTGDSILADSVDAITYQEAIIEVNQDPGEPISSFIFTSVRPEIATVVQDGTVNWVSDGEAKITISGPRANRQDRINVSAVGGQSTSIFDRFADSSVAKNSNDAMMAGISGKTPDNDTLLMFSSAVGDVYVRNVGGWFAAFDLTALVARAATQNNFWMPGQLFTDRLGIGAAHHSYRMDDELWFIDNANNTVKRTIDGIVYLDRANPYTNDFFDIFVFRLSEAVPSGITPLKFMPDDWYNFSLTDNYIGVSGSYQDNGTPWVYANKQKKLFTVDILSMSNNPTPEYPNRRNISVTTQKVTDRKDWWEPTQSGDSGNCGGPLINGKIGLQSTYCSAGSNQDDLSSLLDLIQDVAAGLIPGTILSVYDLAAEGFTDYTI